MRHPRSIITALALAVTIMAGCSSPEPEAPPAPEPAAEVAAELQPYLDALTAIDPGLTVDAERAIRRGERVCERLAGPQDGNMTVAEYTAAEFTGGNATVDAAKAELIIAATQQHLCS